jgi:hypothetical protein
MAKKTYELQNYTVIIDGIEEIRTSVVYYNEIGLEITREFFIDENSILPGYIERNSVIAEQQDPD